MNKINDESKNKLLNNRKSSIKKNSIQNNIYNLSTFKKIIFLQGRLKQITSAKDRFEGIKEKMITKINNNCYNYYKTKINIKQIYGYCESNNPNIYPEYILLPDSKSILLDKYDVIYKAFFILRNNNFKLLKILNSSPMEYYKRISNFIIHFFYENTISNSMNNDELILIIYLVLENLILNKLPENFNINLIKKIFLNNNLEFFLLRELTRRTDIRNYLVSILSDLILKIENYRAHLFVEIVKIDEAKENKYYEENENETNNLFDDLEFNFEKEEINSSDLKTNKSKKIKGKNTKKNKIKDNFEQLLFLKDSAPINIIRTSNIYKSRKSIKINQPKINLFDINIFDEGNDFERLQKFDEPEDAGGGEMVDVFFEETNINITFLNNKIKALSQESNELNLIMIDYINNQINELKSEEGNKENKGQNFSNNIINKDLEQIKKNYNMENYNYIINTIKKNYERITLFIKELLNKLKENINSLPFIIKCLSNIIEILIEKKYSKSHISNFDKFMFKINFFMGNIIIPILSNPYYNGIITNEIISKITKENLKIITKIFKQIISGILFSNKIEPEYTIFNKFIIEIMPEIFEIINNIQQNFELPEIIIKVFNTSDLINNEKRNINYDYFNTNKNEVIQFQSICFSYEILYIIIHIIIIEKDYFITNNKNEEEKKIFEELLNYREKILRWYQIGSKNKKFEYLFFSKINYSKKLEQKMNFIIQKNYHELMLPKNIREDNLILYEFKNCLLGVLAYVNILNKESFESLILRKDQKIYNHNIINSLYQSKLNNKYMKTTFDNDRNEDFDIDNKMEIVTIIRKINEDLDFKNEIFPNIINNTKYEIGYNLEIENNKKITLFLSYLQLHFNDIPKKFSENNYSLLFSELIKETEELINLLNNTSILNKFHLKILEGNKLNTIMNYNFLQIKSIQKSICIQYLYNKISFLSKFTFFHKKGLITKITYEIVQKNDTLMPNVDTIISLIDVIPDFRKYEKYVDDIINLEEKVEFQNALNMYFNDLRKEITNENIIKNFSISDLNSISIELENYIFFKLYDKLYPTKQTKADLDFYNKCLCLNFIKPENLIKNTKIINEKLWKTAINYINEIDEKYTPVEKLKCLGKAISILQNSITFCSGKDELGVDDTIPPLIYILIKSKPKKLISNYNFCSLFLNPELSKKEMGILLSQIGLVINVIKDMSYKDCINISQEEFEEKYNKEKLYLKNNENVTVNNKI